MARLVVALFPFPSRAVVSSALASQPGSAGPRTTFPGKPPPSGISPTYAYADVLAPDTPNAPGCDLGLCPYSLSDFFGGFATQYAFQPISLPSVLCNSQVCYNAEWFEDFGTHVGDPAPSDPDDDAIDPQN
jgi:hypothetical protein